MIQLLFPLRLLIILPLALVLIFLLTQNFVKLSDPDPMRLKRLRFERRLYRIILFFSRLIIIVLLVAAITRPYLEKREMTQGDTTINILVDESLSMDVYDNGIIDTLSSQLELKVPVRINKIASGLNSNIGDGILSHLGKDKNLLLFTDANSNVGSDFQDVAMLAKSLNATISSLDVEPVTQELSISVVGPEKVFVGAVTEYTAIINKIKTEENYQYRVVVTIDDQPVIDTMTSEAQLTFSKEFMEGDHKIVARLDLSDEFRENNIFYKTVHTIKKAKILFVSNSDSPLRELLSQMYDVDFSTKLENVDDYYAVILNNMPANSFTLEELVNLSGYVINGNGLVVVGGDSSYDFGNYNNSYLSTILPVYVGSGKEIPKPEVNAVILIDVSPGDPGAQALPLAKAHALSLLDQFKAEDNVAVIAFADGKAFTLSAMSPMALKNIDELKGKVTKIAYSCELGSIVCSDPQGGFLAAIKNLEAVSGKKWLFLLSDGNFRGNLKEYSLPLIYKLKEIGTQIIAQPTAQLYGNFKDYKHIISLSYLNKIAKITAGGFVNHPERQIFLRFLDPSRMEHDSSVKGYTRTLNVLDSYHFITYDIEPSAVIEGFNSVIPKSNAQLLITTSVGEPFLVVSRFGVGRVATIATDDGSKWSGELLNKENSKLITRIVNWAIEDPERKEPYFISIPDTQVNESTTVTVKSDKFPVADDITFFKVGENLYEAKTIPVSVGFSTLLGKEFAINNQAEYFELGTNPVLNTAVSLTGGKLFKPEQVNEISDFVISTSERLRLVKEDIGHWFVVAALSVFLIEVCIRRIWEKKNAQ